MFRSLMFRSLMLLRTNINELKSIRYESTKSVATICGKRLKSKFEQENQEIEVKEISRETIKPWSPTPSHLKNYTLSILDQTRHPDHYPILFFYPPPSSSQPAPAVDVSRIKRSLRETLSKFYPLAGRLKDASTVSCTDQGIPLIHTHVTNCRLSDVLDSPPDKLIRLTKSLLPPRDLISQQRPIPDILSLVFQINTFDCGGVVIGCYMLHKLLDGASLGTFLNYWAAHTSNRYIDLVDPDFSTAPRLFPPYVDMNADANLQADDHDHDHDKSGPADDVVVVTAKSFVFTKAAITELKTKAASSDLPNPSSFEALAAFVWEQAAAAAAAAAPQEVVGLATSLLLPANIRSETTPPIAKGAIGNLVAPVEAVSKTWRGLPRLAAEIRKARFTVKDKAQEFQGPRGTEAFLAYLESLMPRLIGSQPGSYVVSNCARLGWEDADFGFGKPKRFLISPVNEDGQVDSRFKNFILFTPSGNGIEVWLSLEQKEMDILESNPLFLAFASPT